MATPSTQEHVDKLNREAMEYIWSQVPKNTKDDVEYIVYTPKDIEILYMTGLVDTQRFSLDQWKKAFQDCKQEDNQYWVSYEKMISLGRYRYCKFVGEPFDPLKLQPGFYHIEELWKMYQNSVIPSCSLDPVFIKNTFDRLFRNKEKPKEMLAEEIKKAAAEGKEFKIPQAAMMRGDYVALRQEDLVSLRNLLDQYPSPRRHLEFGVMESRLEKLQQLSNAAHNLQKSGFESGPDFRNVMKKDLKDMLVKASDNPTAGRKPLDEVIDLKAMQKQKRSPTKF